MVSFRFHLVSLTAVFLALALGVLMGVTVIDRATVDALSEQVTRVGERVEATEQENARLAAELARREELAAQLGPAVLDGRLEDAPVAVVVDPGAPEDPVDALVEAVQVADAASVVVARLTDRWALPDPADVTALADAAGVAPGRPGAVRAAALERLATGWATGDGGITVRLRGAGFVDVVLPPGAPGGDEGVAAAVGPGTRLVLVAHARQAPGAPASVAVPLARALVEATPAPSPDAAVPPVVVAEVPRPGGDGTPLVAALREDDSIRERITTVDHLDTLAGRVAAVVALQGVAASRGHYGTGPGAARLLPELG